MDPTNSISTETTVKKAPKPVQTLFGRLYQSGHKADVFGTIGKYALIALCTGGISLLADAIINAVNKGLEGRVKKMDSSEVNKQKPLSDAIAAVRKAQADLRAEIEAASK